MLNEEVCWQNFYAVYPKTYITMPETELNT